LRITAQLFGQGTLRARLETMLQLRQAHDSDRTFIADPYEFASILNEEIEHEAWFIELLAHERDGKTIPSGHFRRGTPGEAPYSKNAGFSNP
jgi:hypothetical protein